MNALQLAVFLTLALAIGAWTGWRLAHCYRRNPFPRVRFDEWVWMPVVAEQLLLVACFVAVLVVVVARS